MFFKWYRMLQEPFHNMFFNRKEFTALNFLETMLTGIVAVGSGWTVVFFVLDWIPNRIMDVLGYKR